MAEINLTKSYELFERAQSISPGGYQAPQNPYFYGYGSSPAFLARGKGCRVWDVDGNEYIDFLCGLGAIVLGMGNRVVDEAARSQMEKGDLMTFPSSKWVELAQYLVDRIPGMDWAIFAKNGSDATTYMTRVARAHTGRSGIAMISHAYHGFHYWCSGPDPSIPPEYQSGVYSFHFNQAREIERLVEEKKGEIAAVILTPVRHDVASAQVLPTPEFLAAVRNICDREGMLLLLDDVRCGFRYHENGSAEYFGVEPDMIAFGKAMSNGYPISAAMGRRNLMEAARKFMFIGTHFYSASPMAAALACLEEIKASGAVEHMLKMGELLKEGILDAAGENGFKIDYSGHPTMPLMMFEDDPIFEKARRFSALALERGVIIHPIHNWFICAAHGKDDVERAVSALADCFSVMAGED